ncbi:MAG: DUF3800 domain-containing protein [Deltaproteobacteria bacterium]|nr:DUF3800 domain-containing protein [Deltaproteobacteria bacterium]
MSYFLFVDESGQDHGPSPYEVLAGVAIQDTRLWNLISDLKAAERSFFGARVTLGPGELKATKLLKRKTFRLARQLPAFPIMERTALAEAAILEGERPTRERLTALAQAKVDYCTYVLARCAVHNVRFFASIVLPDAERPTGSMLRKDYAYLFERFYYFVDAQPEHERGFVIFDEIEGSRAQLLSDQMSAYFEQTRTGQRRASRIIPEPFFVHSELTTGVQIADLVAYVISWNVRVGGMDRPRREELDPLGLAVLGGRHRAVVPRVGYPDGFLVWSFAVIDDLRPRTEIEDDHQRGVREASMEYVMA